MGPDREAGVTLIEMLIALALASLVGLAGFTLLESVTRTEAGLSGRLETLAAQDRAFRLMAMDAQGARAMRLDDKLTLLLDDYTAVWTASEEGLARRLEFRERADVVQRLLSDPALITRDARGLLVVELVEGGVRRVIRHPAP